jgi:hypothetical protein
MQLVIFSNITMYLKSNKAEDVFLVVCNPSMKEL